jgi:hypothetical protein
MPIKVRVLEKARTRKIQPKKGWPPNQLKANPTPWRLRLNE